MENFLLRAANSDDGPRIRRLVRLVRINPMGLDWRRFVILADDRGTFAGCAQVKRHTDGSRELASLAVRPRFRGMGGAQRLIEHFTAQTRRPLYLLCRPELASFYERFGFRTAEPHLLPRYFRRIRRFASTVGRLTHHEGPVVMRLDDAT